MNKYISKCIGLLLPLLACACSETEGETSELANWQSRNETYFSEAYQKAKANPDRYKIIRCWSLEENVAVSEDNNIVVEVLNEGPAGASPLYTDSVRVHYRGYYIPTTSFPAGYVFDQSWTGDYDLATMNPTTFAVGGLIDGFTTALLYMKPGDRWRVTIPYNLGYGTSDYTSTSSTTPAYSTLIFDITLVSFHRPGSE